MKHARIVDGVALDVVQDPAEFYHPDLAALFVGVPNQVQHGWILDDGVWSAPEAGEVAPAAYVAVQLAIIDLLRRFTEDELKLYLAKEAAARGLTPADYASAAEGDEALQLLVGFRIFLTFYDSLRAGIIEINHAQTIQGLGLLVPLGVLTPERLAVILAL